MVHCEGCDKAAWRTSSAYVANCIAKWLEGKTYRGMPYVKYDSMRQCAVFLHIRQVVASGNKTEHKVEHRSEGAKAAASGSVPAPPTPQVSAPPAPQVSAPPTPAPPLKRQNAFVGEADAETSSGNKKGAKRGKVDTATGKPDAAEKKEVICSHTKLSHRNPRGLELALSINSAHGPQRS